MAKTLSLTALERSKTRGRFDLDEVTLFLQLPRGIVLNPADLLCDADALYWVRILAAPEPVLTVTAADPCALLKAAYHLGNRHVPLEVTGTYLRLNPDPVLQTMLDRFAVTVVAEQAPFQPEVGAYRHSGTPHSSTHTANLHSHHH
ncbi:MAG: urease accessory protein UreE [Cyanobacteria bacterium P01_H01_bin.121]